MRSSTRVLVYMVVGVSLVGAAARAQVDPDEAYQRLQQKQKEKETKRAEPVTITRGELEDMQSQISRLEGEVMVLKDQLAAAKAAAGPSQPAVAQPPPAPKPAPRKIPTAIEVGMTRDDLMAFLDRYHEKFRISGVSTHDSPRSTIRQTTVTSDTNNGPASTRTETVETTHTGARRDHLTIDVMAPQQVPAGWHRDALGHRVEDFNTELRRVGWIWVTLVDDVVTAVDSHS